MYWVLISDDAGETGLYDGNEMVLSWRELRERGYDVARIAGWTSRELAWIVRQVEHCTFAVFVMWDEAAAAYVGNQPLLEIVDGGAGKPGTRGTDADLFAITGHPVKIDWTRYSDRRTGRIMKVELE